MLTKFYSKGTFSLLITAKELESSPAFVYKEGKKTDKQRTYQGKKIYRLRGALPLIEGEIVPDGYIYLTSSDVPKNTTLGQIITIQGEISLRAARGFGLTCSLVGRIDNAKEFQLGSIDDE